MTSIRKLIEKEEIKKKKNPGRQNTESRKALNRARRGEPVPVSKVMETKKYKARKRSRLKAELRKRISSEY